MAFSFHTWFTKRKDWYLFLGSTEAQKTSYVLQMWQSIVEKELGLISSLNQDDIISDWCFSADPVNIFNNNNQSETCFLKWSFDTKNSTIDLVNGPVFKSSSDAECNTQQIAGLNYLKSCYNSKLPAIVYIIVCLEEEVFDGELVNFTKHLASLKHFVQLRWSIVRILFSCANTLDDISMKALAKGYLAQYEETTGVPPAYHILINEIVEACPQMENEDTLHQFIPQTNVQLSKGETEIKLHTSVIDFASNGVPTKWGMPDWTKVRNLFPNASVN